MKRYLPLVALLGCVAPGHAASLNGPLITHVINDKAFYSPGSLINVKVTLSNATGSDINGKVNIATCSRGQAVGLTAQNVTLAKGAAATLTFQFTVPSLNAKGYQLSVVGLNASDNASATCSGTGTNSTAPLDTASGAINVAASAWEDPIEAFVDAPTLASSTVTAQQVADNLAQYHVSLVQGYDVLWRHDEPMPTGTSWKNLAGITLTQSEVASYHAALNGYGMKFLAYSLWNGAWSDYQTANPNVSMSMGLFKDNCGATGSCTLSDQGSTGVGAGWPSWGWQSNGIYYMSPSNGAWTAWMASQLASVLTLGFDGIHLDTLGDDGISYYDFAGRPVPNIGGAITTFANYMQDRFGVCTDINQVSMQNIQDVAVRGRSCNLYGEPHPEFGNYSQYYSAPYMAAQYREWTSRPIVLAYYGQQVASGVLPLSDAVNPGAIVVCDPSVKGSAACPANNPGMALMLGQIALAGASPLVVGDYDHLVPGPFFPRATLGINAILQQYLADYWNWFVGQRDVLRDGVVADTGLVAYLTDSNGNAIGNGVGSAGKVFTRPWGKAGIAAGLSLTNLVGLTDNRIDDPDGLHNPTEQTNISATLTYYGSTTPGTLWYSAPDINHGIPRSLTYTTDSTNRKISFTIPDLKTVGQLVLEGGNLSSTSNDYTVNASDFIRGTTANRAVNGMGALSGSLVHGCCRRWARWDAIDLGTSGASTLQATVTSPTGGVIEFHTDAPDGPLLATVYAAKGDSVTTRTANANAGLTGVHAVYAVWPGRDVSLIGWKP